jgi:DNA-binding response OmpR family regulator
MASVLIIDDHQGTLDTFSTVLRRAGHQPVTAETARAGIEAALARSFDVILVDLMLPDMSGVDVIRKLKAQQSSARILLVTAFPSLESSFDASSAGAVGYVEGMLLPDELLAVISQSLDFRFPVPAHRAHW